MVMIEHFLAQLSNKGIRLEPVGDRLTVHAPKGTITPDLAGQIRDRKAEIITFLRVFSAGKSAIPKASREGRLAMSFAQQRLWFLDQLAQSADQDTSHYNMWNVLEIRGSLNIPALEKAGHGIIMRHENLRTNFRMEDGKPAQIIHDQASFDIRIVDGKALSQEAVDQTIREEMGYCFDLANDLLLRMTLVEIAPDHYHLILNMHHIVSDGWSMKIFVRELIAMYQEIIGGPPAALPPLHLQYADFSHWQQHPEQLEKMASQAAWWQEQLKGLPPVHQLPLDRPRPQMITHRGGIHHLEIKGAISAGIQALCQVSGMTPFMVILGAFKVFLSRYSQTSDISIGTPVANRNITEIEPLIGFFVNTLVMRSQVDSSLTFKAFLNQVKTTALGAYDHQDVPFDQVVDHVKPVRHLDHSPLFQISFIHQRMLDRKVQFPGLEIIPKPLDAGIAKFDLTLTTSVDDLGLKTVWEYNRDLFDHETIVSMAQHFEMLLRALLAHPNKQLAEISLLDEASRQALVHDMNQTKATIPGSLVLHRYFEAEVAKHSDHPAIILASGSSMTYAELNQRANQLAWHMVDLGVKPETRVALLAQNSPELIIAMWAILKAGAAIVPLDFHAPKARITHMLEDSDVGLLLVQGKDPQAFPSVTTVDLDQALPSGLREDNLPIDIHPDQAAYLIYTSGSTGVPKASINTHRGMSNHHLWAQSQYPMGPTDRMFFKAPISFDAAMWEFMHPMMVGAQLVVAQAGMEGDPVALRRVMVEREVTHAIFVPSMLRAFLDHLGQQPLKCKLRHIISGGEVLLPQDHQRVMALLSDEDKPFDLVNHYGPSETAISCIYFPCGQVPQTETLPIGKPEGNVRAFIADANLTLLPAGMPGEILVAGPGLARGYFGRPGLTASKFVPNPFETDQPGSRLYRTGDLGRVKSNGAFYFVNRIDNQVKLRGMRLELGEIEACLAAHDAVVQAAVVVNHSEKGGMRLIGYYQAAANAAATLASDLKTQLQDQLPSYMMPSALIPLEALPMLPSGKVARKELALREISLDQFDQSVPFREPERHLEIALASIWQQVLDVDQVGLDHNFFEIGGHSLLATQVVSRVRDELEMEIPLQQIFSQPTVAKLAAWLEENQTGNKLPAITRRPVEQIQTELSFSQQRLWFLDQLTSKEGISTGTYNIFATLKITGDLDSQALQSALTALEQRHETLRANFQEQEGKPVQVIAAEARITLEEHDLSDATEAIRLQKVADLCERGFSLSHDPLFRLDLVRLAPDAHILVLNMHHIISDGWSMTILVRELVAFYTQTKDQVDAALPELTVQYGDFATWQRSDEVAAELDRQATWWQERLEGLPVVHQIPTDRPRPKMQSQNGATLQVPISGELIAKLEQIAQDQGGTLYMALLSAFQLLIAKYSNQKDIVIGTPIANRNRVEIEPLIGFFVNTLVLRAWVDQEESYLDLLIQVTQTTLESYSHQDVPFERIVDLVQPARHTSHSPLFQIMFSLQNTPNKAITLPDLVLEPVGVETHTAKFDLHLDTVPTEDGLVAVWQYNTDLFRAETIEAMATQYGQLIQALVDEPAKPMRKIELLSNDMRRRLIVEMGQNHWEADFDIPAHRHFEVRANEHPQHTALVVDGEIADLSYERLNQRANQCAWGLMAAGVGRETRVALFAKSSPELLIGLLAILKAGGVVLPIDPNAPETRIQHMLEDSGVRIVLGQSAWIEHLDGYELHALDGEAIYHDRTDNPNLNIDPDQAAFLIYTSGSTGVPKASMNTHRGLSNHNLWVQHISPMNATDRLIYKTPMSFDVAMWECLWPLMAGAQLVIGAADIAGDPFELRRLIENHAVTHAFFVPSMLRVFLDTIGKDVFKSSLRLIFAAGEALLPQDQQRVLRHLHGPEGPVLIRNHYGPSEAAITVTHYACAPKPQTEAIPIGQPNGNTDAFVVDSHLNLVPLGMPGELVIGGTGVSRGYQGRPGLTALKFVPHPFTQDKAGARLYKTGDVSRMLADGHLRYLGRADHQIKLRGMRIELGEIETLLRDHDAVHHASVQLAKNPNGQENLVALVHVTAESPDELMPQLRIHLAKTLPAYMVPSSILPLEDWPFLPSGKVDSPKLAAIAADHHTHLPAREYVAPRNEIETVLAEIWQDVLGLEQVSVHDNFFEVGGHSLLATQVLSRIRQAFPEKLSLQYLFERPTIAAISEGIENIRTSLNEENFSDDDDREDFEF